MYINFFVLINVFINRVGAVGIQLGINRSFKFYIYKFYVNISFIYIYLLWDSFIFIWCVVFNQGCCAFIQYNLLKGCCESILI